jgi:sec-independent protein translocase protein TatA
MSNTNAWVARDRAKNRHAVVRSTISLYYRVTGREESEARSNSREVMFMFGLGLGELLLLLVIVMIVFNRRLPDLGEGLGKSVKKFRRAMNEPEEIDVTPKDSSKS